MSLQDIRYWFEDLELRKKLNENQLAILVGLVIIILFCLTLVLCQLTAGGRPPLPTKVKLVYFDLANQSIMIVEQSADEPQNSPLQGTDDVFRANILSCEDCPKGKIKDGMTLQDLQDNNMFVAWLERPDPDATDEQAARRGATMYRLLDNDRWYTAADPKYNQIILDAYGRCTNAKTCLP